MSNAPGTGEAVLFWILGPLAVLGSLGLIFAKKAVHAALGMALTMIILGIFYIAQDAHFLGVAIDLDAMNRADVVLSIVAGGGE